jgi:hypothetical protein
MLPKRFQSLVVVIKDATGPCTDIAIVIRKRSAILQSIRDSITDAIDIINKTIALGKYKKEMFVQSIERHGSNKVRIGHKHRREISKSAAELGGRETPATPLNSPFLASCCDLLLSSMLQGRPLLEPTLSFADVAFEIYIPDLFVPLCRIERVAAKTKP